MLKFIKIILTFIASLRPIVPLVHTARLVATSMLLVSPAGASAAEFNIHGSNRNHIAEVGNDPEQHEKRTRKARSKQGKKGESKSPRPQPTPPPPQGKTMKPKSQKARPTNAPTATDPVAPQGKIFMTISAIFNISNITVVKGRRQLDVTRTVLTTIMEATIQDVVRSSLNADQSLILVEITSIDDVSINGSPAGTTTIYSQVSLTENCTNADCEAQLSKTTMNSTVISYMNQQMDNGNFTEIFQENADDQCAENPCEDVKNATLVGGAFDETNRGQVAVPTESPSVDPTTLTPTSSKPTAGSPSIAPSALPTSAPTKFPSTVPTAAPSSNATTLTPTSSQPPTVIPTSAAPTPLVPTTESPTRTPGTTCDGGLKPSPISCPPGFTCLQNCDFGNENTTRFNIDISLELNSTVDTKDAYVRALAKWTDVITGDLLAAPRSLISNSSKGNCTNDLPSMVDDVHICGKDVIIDGVGKVLGNARALFRRVNQITGKVTTVTGMMR